MRYLLDWIERNDIAIEAMIFLFLFLIFFCSMGALLILKIRGLI